MNDWSASTRAIHPARDGFSGRGLAPALYQSSVFHADTLGQAVDLETMAEGFSSYTRVANPTVQQFEREIAALEGGAGALATPSGMAALCLVFLSFLRPGGTVVASPHSYTDTVSLLTELSGLIGFELVLVDLTRPEAPDEITRLRPQLTVLESPSNPMALVSDIAAIAARVRETGGMLVVDGTVATPVNQQPLALGADLVVHSASKYLSGHSTTIAGAVVGPADAIERMHHVRTMSGLCLDPHSAWLLLQGLQTLDIRVRRQNETAGLVAAYLAGHPGVEFVSYPGLPDAPGHAVAARQMSGFGGLLAFGPRLDAWRLAVFVESLELCTLAVSLGSVKTLIEIPALMSHAQGGPDHATLRYVPANTVRLSLGLEDAQDVIDDLARGLAKAAGDQ